MTSKKLSLLNNILLFIVLFGMVQFSTVYATPPVEDNSDSKLSTSSKSLAVNSTSPSIDLVRPNGPVEKDFDQIRHYQSYDPATNIWSQIEDFKTVEILEDTSQHRDEHYLYYSFWAYDAQQKKWKRVDIRDYGYKYGKHVPPISSTDLTKEESTEETEEQESSSLWKNLGLTFSVGGGGTYFYNKFEGLDLMVRTGSKELFAQVSMANNPSDKSQGKAHLIRWFSNGLKKMSEIKIDKAVHDEHSLREIKDEDGAISFRGIGFNIPITLGLHYTFFKKLRVGAGGNFEINYLKELKGGGQASDLAPYEPLNPWFYNLKWFGTLGYKVFQRPKHAVILDTQLGVVFDLGESPKEYLFEWLHSSFFASLGAAHETKLNDYFKFFYRLSVDFKQYNDDKHFATPHVSLKLFQPAMHLEIGTTLNFGRDKDEEAEDHDEDTSSDKNQDSSLDKMSNAVGKAEGELNRAQQMKNRAQADKSKLKGLFR